MLISFKFTKMTSGCLPKRDSVGLSRMSCEAGVRQVGSLSLNANGRLTGHLILKVLRTWTHELSHFEVTNLAYLTRHQGI